MSPGWVKTDSGGEGALIDTKTSVTGMINVIRKLELKSSEREILSKKTKQIFN